MVITDLDRTLLNDDHCVSDEDDQTLRALGERGVLRVIATGRSVFSLKRVISDPSLFDYLIFSTGAGIMEWKTGQMLQSRSLDAARIRKTADLLIALKMDFMIQKSIPDNHHFLYHYGSEKDNPDFFRRIDLYRGFTEPVDGQIEHLTDASQFLVIDPSGASGIEALHRSLPGFSIIRATSPIDHKTMWIEIFPANVSKGHAADWLCGMLGISKEKTIGIGNDFNDVDLLEWTGNPWVVANAHDDLKAKYPSSLSRNGQGFSEIIRQLVLNKE